MKDKIVSHPTKNIFKNADYDLSKPVLLQNMGLNKPSRLTVNPNQVQNTTLKSKNEMTLITSDNKEEEKKTKWKI